MFYNIIMPKLGRKNKKNLANDWYVKVVCESFNEYMKELEQRFKIPTQVISGTITQVTPAGVTVTIPYTTVGYLVSNKLRFTQLEIKKKMWCGDINLTFPNLFNLFAKKLERNFRLVKTKTIDVVKGSAKFRVSAIPSYTLQGSIFMTTIKGMATSGTPMTPEIFHTIWDKYMELALKGILPTLGSFKGIAKSGGIFSGTVTIRLG